jgi:hypothetical protein
MMPCFGFDGEDKTSGGMAKMELKVVLFKQTLRIINGFVNRMLLGTMREKIFALSF